MRRFRCDCAKEDAGQLAVLRLSRSLAVSSFGVGFFSYVCILDVTRHTLSEWLDLLASPGAARYYALLVALFLLSRCTLFARRVPEYSSASHAVAALILALARSALMLALGWLAAFRVGLWLVEARAGIVGWGGLPSVSLALVAAMAVLAAILAPVMSVSGNRAVGVRERTLLPGAVLANVLVVSVAFVLVVSGCHRLACALINSGPIADLTAYYEGSSGDKRAPKYNVMLLAKDEVYLHDGLPTRLYSDTYGEDRGTSGYVERDPDGRVTAVAVSDCDDPEELVERLLGCGGEGVKVYRLGYGGGTPMTAAWSNGQPAVWSFAFRDGVKYTTSVRTYDSYGALCWCYVYDPAFGEDSQPTYGSAKVYDPSGKLLWYYGPEDYRGEGNVDWHQAS